jgi:hypothetical protein
MNPKTTDQRQAQGIAWAVVERCVELGGTDLAEEGRGLLFAVPTDWAALLAWNRRACEWIVVQNKRAK